MGHNKTYKMPRGTVDYSNGLIYKLCCKDPNVKDMYVGSCTNFRKRKYGHKAFCNNENDKSYNHYKYQFIRENGGWDNWEMVLIENYNATDKRDLERKEEEIRKQLGATLNTNKAYITEQERYQYKFRHQVEKMKDPEFREEQNRKKREWREKNREEQNRKQREWKAEKMKDPKYIERIAEQTRQWRIEKMKDPKYIEEINRKQRERRAERMKDPKYREEINRKQRERRAKKKLEQKKE